MEILSTLLCWLKKEIKLVSQSNLYYKQGDVVTYPPDKYVGVIEFQTENHMKLAQLIVPGLLFIHRKGIYTQTAKYIMSYGPNTCEVYIRDKDEAGPEITPLRRLSSTDPMSRLESKKSEKPSAFSFLLRKSMEVILIPDLTKNIRVKDQYIRIITQTNQELSIKPYTRNWLLLSKKYVGKKKPLVFVKVITRIPERNYWKYLVGVIGSNNLVIGYYSNVTYLLVNESARWLRSTTDIHEYKTLSRLSKLFPHPDEKTRFINIIQGSTKDELHSC